MKASTEWTFTRARWPPVQTETEMGPMITIVRSICWLTAANIWLISLPIEDHRFIFLFLYSINSTFVPLVAWILFAYYVKNSNHPYVLQHNQGKKGVELTAFMLYLNFAPENNCFVFKTGLEIWEKRAQKFKHNIEAINSIVSECGCALAQPFWTHRRYTNPYKENKIYYLEKTHTWLRSAAS